jgi:ZU5 domain-containing protein
MLHRSFPVIVAIVLVAACAATPTTPPTPPPSPPASAATATPATTPGPTLGATTSAASTGSLGTPAPTDTPASPSALTSSPAPSAGSPEPSTAPSLPVASPPAPSAVGKTTGPAVSATIGSSGGSLSSADGGIHVTIPAGALATDTTIGIQPIENTAPNGLDGAFRLTPAGQTFSQPVQLSFPYTDADLAGTAPEALGIAFQDAEGLWEWQDAVAVDTTSKQLSVSMTHFTDFSKVPGLQLRPPSASVHLNGSVRLTVATCLVDTSRGNVIMFPCFAPPDVPGLIDASSWAVNGAPGGTTGTGFVTGFNDLGGYIAPPRKPAVGSTVDVSVISHFKGRTATLNSIIRIISGYRVVGDFLEMDSNRVCAVGISASITDHVEFSLTPAFIAGADSFVVTDIQNSDTIASRPRKTPPPPPLTTITLVTKPEILTAQKGVVIVEADHVSVVLEGPGNDGACSWTWTPAGASGKTIPYSRPGSASLGFFMKGFDNGKLSVPGTPDQQWSWFVTEQ